MGEAEGRDTHEPLPQRPERHAFDRLIMLSDGVFAIAITPWRPSRSVPERVA